MNPIIEVNNISKSYSIGRKEAYGSLREEIMQAITSPFRRSGVDGDEETLWALKDVSFTVNEGDVLGVIGRNGAGKSTLLKILSRITEPTSGRIVLRGRVASLLEVGTGFHPELTGRENILLNGALLGMSRKEITSKFDEIVAFSEIEKFLDTPVKRYSSGMYVRLAFAVAAHLEPEILIIDEVLAVGDAQFQKKCLGKMGDVARGGRTVLFVSHNMGAVRALCNRAILLLNGKVTDTGSADDVIQKYLSSSISKDSSGEVSWEGDRAPGGKEVRLRSIRLLSPEGRVSANFDVEKPIKVEISYEIFTAIRGMRMLLQLTNSEGVVAFTSTDHNQRPAESQPGVYRTYCTIPGKLLNEGFYYVKVHSGCPGVKVLVEGKEFLSFWAERASHHGSHFPEKWPGVVAPGLEWSTEAVAKEGLKC